jgi:tetratricopeptide repeat protein 30
MAKQMIMINDQVAQDIMDFFETCEVHGRLIRTVEDLPFAEEDLDAGKHSVAYEARLLKDLMQRLI